MIELDQISESSWSLVGASRSKRRGASHSEWIKFGRTGRPYIYLNVSLSGAARILVEGGAADIKRLNRLSFAGLSVDVQSLDVEFHGHRDWIVVACTAIAHRQAFTAIVREICELMLKHRVGPSDSINRVIAKWRSFWGKPLGEFLSEEQQLGLLAELLVLQKLMNVSDEKVVFGWKGPRSRHDFEFGRLHVEAKSTLRGRHSHIINGVDQLEPPRNKELYLASVLAVGALRDGYSIADLVRKIEKKLEDLPDEYQHFVQVLVDAGYRREHEERYASVRFAITAERWLSVTSDFPRLSSRMLRGGLSSRISEVRYRLDLEGLPELSQLPRRLRALLS